MPSPPSSPRTTPDGPSRSYIRAKFRAIQRDPLIYQLRTEIGEDARMATVGNHAILFRIAGSAVRIERVVYAGRDLPGVFDVSEP